MRLASLPRERRPVTRANGVVVQDGRSQILARVVRRSARHRDSHLHWRMPDHGPWSSWPLNLRRCQPRSRRGALPNAVADQRLATGAQLPPDRAQHVLQPAKGMARTVHSATSNLAHPVAQFRLSAPRGAEIGAIWSIPTPVIPGWVSSSSSSH